MDKYGLASYNAVFISLFFLFLAYAYYIKLKSFNFSYLEYVALCPEQKFSKRDLIIDRMKEYLEKQSLMRQGVFESYLRHDHKEFGDFYNALAVEVTCPMLVKVGRVLDGGKWVCNPMAIQSNCIVYSFGVSKDNSFESDLQDLTNSACETFSFDRGEASASLFTHSQVKRMNFESLTVGSMSQPEENIFTIEDIMKKYNHTALEFLKIDIEGTELEALPQFLQSAKFLPCQVFVEIHGTPRDVAKLLQSFANNKYWLFSYEINGIFPKLCEYSFIHQKCLSKYGISSFMSKNFRFVIS